MDTRFEYPEDGKKLNTDGKEVEVTEVCSDPEFISYFKDAKAIEDKLKSYLHHREYDLEPLGVNKIQSMIQNNIPVYNLNIDMRKSKFGGNMTLKMSNDIELPEYINNNDDKFKKWFV